MSHKIIGIIGGIAPASTVDYYISIVEEFQKRTNGEHYPPILVNSIDMIIMRDLIIEKEYEKLIDYLSNEISVLEKGGAYFAALASNTPHIVFDELKKKSNLPLISIVEAAITFSKKNGFKNLGLFGTKFTMQGGLYQNVASKENIKIFLPQDEEQNYIHEHYMNEFVKGTFHNEVKNELVGIARKLKTDHNIDGLILGGTEIPLILKPEYLPELQLINTTKVHVNAILDYAMS
jgi:aspartate racemase